MQILIELELKEEPNACSKCPFYQEYPYQCHNERGMEANCKLGFMTGDMRDISFRSEKRKNEKYSGCRLEYKIL